MNDSTTTLAPALSQNYRTYTPKEWYLKNSHRVNQNRLTKYDINLLQRLVGANEQLPESSLRRLYYPLAGFLAQQINTFKNTAGPKSMFIIGISGSVAVGKSTGARLLTELLKKFKFHVEMITTDHFLLDQDTLTQRQLNKRKGFPESYNEVEIQKFLKSLADQAPYFHIPTYDHVAYTILPGLVQEIPRPEVLILEGINVLQRQDFPLNFSMYFDAKEEWIEQWYIDRFLSFRKSTFLQPGAYFERFAHLNDAEATQVAQSLWTEINRVNLLEYIQPSRAHATCIIGKNQNHGIQTLTLAE